MPELVAEIRAERFLWHLTKAWHQVKNDRVQIGRFWNAQEPLLEDFDKRFPANHRPAFPANQRPALPGKVYPTMLAKGSIARHTLPPPPAPSLAPPAVPKKTHSPPLATPIASAMPKSRSPPPNVLPSSQARAPSPNANRFAPLAEGAGMSIDEPDPAEDEDAEGSDESVPASLPASLPKAPKKKTREIPAPVRQDKGKGREGTKPAGKIKPTPKMKPGQDKNAASIKVKPKPKPVQPVEDEDEESEYETQTEQSETPAPAPAPTPKPKSKKKEMPAPDRKGKGKPEKKSKSSGTQEKKRAPPKPSGIFRKTPCKRCTKGKRQCEEQVGEATACVFCASQKMACVPPTDAENDSSDSDETEEDPAPVKVSKKRVAPAPTPARKAKLPESDEESDDPAPVKVSKKRKAPAPTPAPKANVQLSIPLPFRPNVRSLMMMRILRRIRRP
jgi:hypothetical protein